MSKTYKGPIGPPTAMSANDQQFGEAYGNAVQQMLAAVLQFELTTGRIVDEISLERVDVTTVAGGVPQHSRQVDMHFLPKPGEVAW